MTSSRDVTSLLAFELLEELQRFRTRRFEWTVKVRDQIITDWKQFYEDYVDWLRRAKGILQTLKDEGKEDLADKLAVKLLSRKNVLDPANFQLNIPTGCGHETWEIRGSDEVREVRDKFEAVLSICNDDGDEKQLLPADVKAEPDTVETLDIPLARSRTVPSRSPQLLSLARPVDFDVEESDVARWKPITLSEATKNKLWLCCTQSGSVFCVECPCAEMVTATASSPHPDAPETHDLIPRHFHVDPFNDDNALVHFLKVHRETFPGGVGEMLQKYARRVDFNNGPRMDKWALSAHNLATKYWYEDLFLTWKNFQEQQSRPGRRQRSRATHVSQVDRTIDFPKISEQACIFQWPYGADDSNHWAVICSHPECGSPNFGHHPLRKERAIQHFQSHGVYLEDDAEVVELFGYRVSNYPSDSTSTDGDDDGDDTPVDSDAPKTSHNPNGPPRLINGRAVYHIWGYKALYRECIQRGIRLPDNPLQKSSLEKKLRMHDGFPDYNDSSEWPFQRLQDECLKHSIPIMSEHGTNVYTRTILIKKLESDDIQLRQQSTASGHQASPDQQAASGQQTAPDQHTADQQAAPVQQSITAQRKVLHEGRAPLKELPNAGNKRRLTTGQDALMAGKSKTRLPTLKPAPFNGSATARRGRPPANTALKTAPKLPIVPSASARSSVSAGNRPRRASLRASTSMGFYRDDGNSKLLRPLQTVHES